jgi:hypothetical protein
MQYCRCALRGDHPAHTFRKRIKLAPEKAIFIFVDDILPPTAALMSSIYDEHKWVAQLIVTRDVLTFVVGMKTVSS